MSEGFKIIAMSVVAAMLYGVAHALDPDATGLLLLTLGRATRLTRFLIRAPKVYDGTVRFGSATDTYDASGRVTSEAPVPELSLELLRQATATLEGTYEQSPPPFSARKIQGVRAYAMARRGEEVPETSKEVTVYEFAPTGSTGDRMDFRLACSSGTYARTLAHQLGMRIGCGAHLAALRRTRIGNFDVGDAIRLAELQETVSRNTEAPGAALGASWIDFDRIPLPFEEAATDAQQEQRIAHGQTVLLRDLTGGEGDWVKVTNSRREFIAVGTVVERIGASVGVVQPKIVFK